MQLKEAPSFRNSSHSILGIVSTYNHIANHITCQKSLPSIAFYLGRKVPYRLACKSVFQWLKKVISILNQLISWSAHLYPLQLRPLQLQNTDSFGDVILEEPTNCKYPSLTFNQCMIVEGMWHGCLNLAPHTLLDVISHQAIELESSGVQKSIAQNSMVPSVKPWGKNTSLLPTVDCWIIHLHETKRFTSRLTRLVFSALKSFISSSCQCK